MSPGTQHSCSVLLQDLVLSDDFPLTSCTRQVKMPKHPCSWEQISTDDRWKLVGTYTSFLSLGREPNIAFNKLLLQKFRENNHSGLSRKGFMEELELDLLVKVKVKSLSHVLLFVTPWTVAHQAPPSMDSPGKNTGVGCHFLLQGIFLTQGLNPGLPHSRQML